MHKLLAAVLCFCAMLCSTPIVYAKDFNPREVVVPITIKAHKVTTIKDNEEPKTEYTMRYGSGVIISPGYIITNAHVLGDASPTASIEFHRMNSPRIYSATVVSISKKLDLMLLHSDDAKCPCAPTAELPPVVDQEVISVGFPKFSDSDMQILEHGHFQGFETTFEDGGPSLLSTGPASFGSSGGALFGLYGKEYKLIGILDAIPTLPGHENKAAVPVMWLSYAIPIPIVIDFINSSLSVMHRPPK